MNIFLRPDIGAAYDDYYQTEFGKEVDRIEKEIISGFLDNVSGEEMVDLGCGTGHWTEFFLKKGFKMKGVDISESMLHIAQKKHIDTEFILADATNLPFENESYSLVASVTMLEFIEDQDKAIREMYRILKKDGWLIMGFLNADSITGKNKDSDEIFKHACFFNRNTIRSKFKSFELLETKCGVYLNDDLSILDNIRNYQNTEPVFIGALFKKSRI